MLRSTLIIILIVTGSYYALQSPFYALLFYIWNAYFRPEDFLWGDLLRVVPLSLVIGGYVVLSTLLSRAQIIWNGRIALLWAFVGLSLVSAFTSRYDEIAWPKAIEFLKVHVITYLLIILTTDFGKFRMVALVIVLSLGLQQGKQGWVYLLTSPGIPNNNPISFLGDNNQTAIGMLMLTPLAGLVAQTAQRKWEKNLFRLISVGCFYRALSTYSRGGFLASGAMAIVWWSRSTQKLRLTLVAAFLALIIVPSLPSYYWDRIGTIQTYDQQQDESALGRLHFWAVAMRMVDANPLMGIGFSAFNQAYDKYDFSNGQFGSNRAVHNVYFGVLAELGYTGLFLYMLIIGGALLSCLRVSRLAKRLPDRFVELSQSANALGASLIAFIVGGCFVSIQYNEMLWHLLGLTIALESIATRSVKDALATPKHEATEIRDAHVPVFVQSGVNVLSSR